MTKQLLLEALTKDALLGVADRLGMTLSSRTPADEVRAKFLRSRRSVGDIVDVLLVDDLQSLCREFELRVAGTKEELQDRLRDWAENGGQVHDPDEDDALEEEDESTRLRFVERSYVDAFWRELAYSVRHAHPARPYQREAVDALRRGLRADTPGLLHVATGGGKTRIANDFVQEALAKGGWVLWVTKDWRLLRQAARDAARRHRGLDARLTRVGGSGTCLHPLPEGIASGGITYTTLHTLSRRIDELSKEWPAPALVVWDECHWGGTSKVGRQLLRACRARGLRLLGLTATPRASSASEFQALYRMDFPALVEQGYLARPRLHEPIRTQVHWAPRRTGPLGDVTQASLRELAENTARNKLIVEHYHEHHQRYGKSIVFACNKAHAETLSELFNRRGHPSRPVHSGLGEAMNAESIGRFERSEVNVLVNVAMLTTGFDVPDARTVFLCRPTMSDVLFAQMVGRASRLDPESGKTHFEVVEFTDTLQQFGNDLVHGKDVFGSAAVEEPRPRRSTGAVAPRVGRHGFNPRGQPLWLGEGPDVDEALRGLWVRQGQTFGIEFELTRDDFDADMDDEKWLETAEPLRLALEKALPGLVAPRCLTEYGAPDKDHTTWNVERDGSCGWEVTTRVLQDESGYAEVVQGCRALAQAADELGLKVNYRTGTHVHIGWMGESVDHVKRALMMARAFEPAVATLVSPSRLLEFDGESYSTGEPNEFCQPVSAVFTRRRLSQIKTIEGIKQAVKDRDTRYVTFNIRPLQDINTMEVRLHNGTLEAGKILLWLSLWKQILWAAENGQLPEDPPDTEFIEPTGDVLALAHEYLPPVPAHFYRRLHQRRLEVRDLWGKVPALRRWLVHSNSWNPRYFPSSTTP